MCSYLATETLPVLFRTYFRPENIPSASFEHQLDALEEFWDTEAPRIGESGSKGWSNWKGSETSNEKAFLTHGALVPPGGAAHPSSVLDGYQRWVAKECEMDAFGWLSQREETEDPYSTVMFSDIRMLLFPPLTASQDLSLLFVFLELLGLHIPGFVENLSRLSPSAASEDSVWSYTAFSVKEKLRESLFASNPTLASGNDTALDELIIGKERRMGSGWGPVKSWSLGVGAPLEGHGPRGEGRMWEGAELEGVDVEFVRYVYQRYAYTDSSELY